MFKASSKRGLTYVHHIAKENVESHHTLPNECPRCGCEGWHKWDRSKVGRIEDTKVKGINHPALQV